MDATHIDARVNHALARSGLCLPARRIAARAVAALLALAAGAAMAADVHAPPTPPVLSHLSGAPPDAAAPDPAASSALNALTAHTRPAILPMLSDEVRLAAQQEGKRLRSMAPVVASAPAPTAHPVEATSVASTSKARVTADSAVAYALVTDITRTRVASELRQQLMGSSATIGELPGAPRTDLMQVGTGWRAVVWPFATEPEADKARRLLAERGIRTELLKF